MKYVVFVGLLILSFGGFAAATLSLQYGVEKTIERKLKEMRQVPQCPMRGKALL